MSSSSDSESTNSSSSAPSVSLGKRKREKQDQIQPYEYDHDASVSCPDHEVQVLSHAEQRRQRKKNKLDSPSKEAKTETLTPNIQLVTGPASSADITLPKRQNSIWVGNLAFRTTPENLRAFLADVGEITRIHMPTKASRGPGIKFENRGFAYVDFSTPEGKTAAIALSEKPLMGRKLLIKDGDDFTGRPTPSGTSDAAHTPPESSNSGTGYSKTAKMILRAQKQRPAPTLFLGNLGFETTEQSIRDFLEAHRLEGKGFALAPSASSTAEGNEDQNAKLEPWIRKVRMGTFEDSGLCKGFAFVDFTSVENATSALVNPRNHTMDGRKLVVEYASPEAVRRGGISRGSKLNEIKPPSKRSQRVKPFQRRIKRGETSSPTKKEKKRAKSSSIRADQDREGGERERKKRRVGDAKVIVASTTGAKANVPRLRPKPGAALALAQRESAAILPSQTTKIVFSD